MAPLVELDKAAVIGISSPLGTDNFFSQLLNTRTKRGKRMFTVYYARGACQACIDTLDNPAECEHVSLPQPPWKSDKQREVARAFYMGDIATYARESLGVITDQGANVFNRKSVNRLLERARVPVPVDEDDENIVYVSIDPCGDGASQFGVVSMTLVDNQITIIGIENSSIGGLQGQQDLTISHVAGIQAMYRARNDKEATVVMVVESNLSSHAEMLISATNNSPKCLPVQALQESGKQKAGVLISNKRKDDYVQVVTKILDTGGVRIADHVHSSSGNAEQSLDTLRMQLLAFSCVDTDAFTGSAFRTSKVTYSGKVNAKGQRTSNQLQDDLAVAFQQGIYWGFRHREISSSTAPVSRWASTLNWD